jgi:hypothetical protein
MNLNLNSWLAVLLFTLAIVSSLFAGASSSGKEETGAVVPHNSDAESMRFQGEQRFRP